MASLFPQASWQPKAGKGPCDVTKIVFEMNNQNSGRMASNISIDSHHMYMVYPLRDNFII